MGEMRDERRGVRENKLREAVMIALQYMNSSNFGQALMALHNAIKIFDDNVRQDFADQDAKLARAIEIERKRELKRRLQRQHGLKYKQRKTRRKR